MQFCQDIPWVLATGGSNGEMAIWDTSENEKTERQYFSARYSQIGSGARDARATQLAAQ